MFTVSPITEFTELNTEENPATGIETRLQLIMAGSYAKIPKVAYFNKEGMPCLTHSIFPCLSFW